MTLIGALELTLANFLQKLAWLKSIWDSIRCLAIQIDNGQHYIIGVTNVTVKHWIYNTKSYFGNKYENVLESVEKSFSLLFPLIIFEQ